MFLCALHRHALMKALLIVMQSPNVGGVLQVALCCIFCNDFGDKKKSNELIRSGSNLAQCQKGR